VTDPESLSDPSIAFFRSWLIEHLGQRPNNSEKHMRIAVSND